MDIKITEQEKIRVIDGQDIFGIMRKILLREESIDQDKEHFWMVGLDASNRLLFIELVVIGGAYAANIRPAEVFRVAVWKNAISVVLVHNHPGREVRPSDADKDLTDNLIQVGRILNIAVVDHLIITPETFFSFEIGGLMEELRQSMKYVPPYEVAEKIREAAEKAKAEGIERGMRRGIREGKMDGLKEGKEEGLRQGIQQGIQLGVELKFGSEALTLIPDIHRIQDIEVLNTIHNGLKSVNSLEELQGIYRGYPDKGGEES